MKAVVFGKFPQQFVHDRIVPQLEKLGIEVLSFDTNPAKFAKANLEGVDVVFFLSELAAHKEQDQIRQSIRRYNTKLVYLSRKTSLWPEQFQRAGLCLPQGNQDMARPAIVQNIDGFLRKYIELKERGFSLDDMVPTLRDFFPNLKDGKHLSGYISRLRTQTPEKLPQFFVQYEAGHGIAQEETHSHESAPSSAPTVAPASETDDADLLQLADQEIQEHKKEIERLSAALKDANKALDELKKKTNGTLKENVTLIRRGIKTGLFTPDEGLAKLEALLQ